MSGRVRYRVRLFLQSTKYLGQKNTWTLITIKPRASVIQMLKVIRRNFGSGFAECTLEPSSSVDELHERRHVGLTSDAPDRTRGSEVCHWRFDFTLSNFGHRCENQGKWNARLFAQLFSGRNSVHCRSVT